MFTPTRRDAGKKKRDLSEYGLFNISNDIDDDGVMDDNDSDLEAELAAITAGKEKPRKKPARPPPMAAVDLDALVAETLKDVDENVSSGEDDPDLMDELNEIIEVPVEQTEQSTTEEEQPSKPDLILPTTQMSIPALIKSRIEMYKAAEENAKTNNDTSRARRFGRGLKTLNDLLRQANAGKTINIDDIPPEVVTKPSVQPDETAKPNEEVAIQQDIPKPVPIRAAPPPPPPKPTEVPAEEISDSAKQVDDSIINALLEKQKEYKVAALNAKKDGNTEVALKFVRVLKMFDSVIKAAQDGQPIDLSDMPPPPTEFDLSIFDAAPAPSVTEPLKEDAEKQNSSEIPAPPSSVPTEPPEAPKTVLEALIQRLELYKSIEQNAKAENNNSKARRFGRIVKQYEDAIKSHKAGKPVPYDELPTPPNFPPIPTGNNQNTTNQPAQPIVPPRQKLSQPADSENSSESPAPKPRPRLQKQDSRVSGNHSSTTVMNKTIAIILERQKEFKNAAIEAKKANELDEAKEYLKTYKGLENLLDVARGGMPIDLSTLPIAPSQRAQLEDSFIVVDQGDCADEETNDISNRLEEQLQKQLTLCKTTRDHNKALGDVAGTNRFENLALGIQKDLDFVRIAKRNKLPIPKFHYEKKSFNILRCNTDLTENELEIEIIRGISYNVSNPKDIDTYVKIEFPYPQETPFRAKTQLVKDTDSPEYNEKFTTEIQPKLRQCQRIFKRQAVKCEIYSRGGFFRSDTLIGTANVKLQPLETSCEIHDSFILMDGRKTVGGKLEVKVRIRNPILTKQMEHIEEKWLIIDS